MDKNYDEYHERLADRIDSFVTDKHKNILIFGNRFEKLEATWKKKNKNIVHLDTLKDDWQDLCRENPDFDLSAKKGSFDMLISYHGLEEALDPERLLLELRKYLVKEGDFITTTYNVSHISTVVNLLTEGWEHKPDGALREGHIRYFSYFSLKELMKLSGFDMVGEDIYGLQQLRELTAQLVQLTKNPYLNALSFIFRGKRVESFPFVEGTYP